LVAEVLQRELKREADVIPEYRVRAPVYVTVKELDLEGAWELIGDNGALLVGFAQGHLNPKETLYYISGVTHQLFVAVDAQSGAIQSVKLRQISHHEYVRSSSRTKF